MVKINKEMDLRQNPQKIMDIVKSFTTTDKPRLQKYIDYYKGNQIILNKKYADPTKPCNKIVKNYCYSITNNYLGYMAGIPITYKSNEDITKLMDVFQFNDIENADMSFLRDALIYGVSYEICYVDEEGKTRFKTVNPLECIPVYDDTLEENLLYMIRFYKGTEKDKYVIELYNDAEVVFYSTNENISELHLISEIPHYFHQVPFVEFPLNSEKASIFDKVMSLQDAYNELLSSEVDDFQAFTDAYLVLKGTGIDDEDVPAMRENRILIMDAEDSAEYLTKNISDTQIENMLKNLNDSIHVISNSPDFNDEKFMATSGIAMRYKMVGFENTSAAILGNMTKALQKRIELIYEILNLVGADQFKDVEIKFTRNLPTDTNEIIGMVNSLRGMISDKTLLSLLPFVNNVDAEMEAIQEQKANNIDIYSFERNDRFNDELKDDVNE